MKTFNKIFDKITPSSIVIEYEEVWSVTTPAGYKQTFKSKAQAKKWAKLGPLIKEIEDILKYVHFCRLSKNEQAGIAAVLAEGLYDKYLEEECRDGKRY